MCASKLTFIYVVLWGKMTSKCYLPKKNMWYDWKLFKVLMLRLFSKLPNSRTIVKTQLSCYKDKKKICLSLLVFLLLSFNLCCCVFVPFQCGFIEKHVWWRVVNCVWPWQSISVVFFQWYFPHINWGIVSDFNSWVNTTAALQNHKKSDESGRTLWWCPGCWGGFHHCSDSVSHGLSAVICPNPAGFGCMREIRAWTLPNKSKGT